MRLQQLDIRTTCLIGDALEEIYMLQPIGYVDALQLYHVCLLLQGLYGLRQSANLWNEKFDDILFQFDLMVSPANPCVYYNKGDLQTIIGIYVDDGVIVSAQQSHTNDIITYLQNCFQSSIRHHELLCWFSTCV